MSSSLLIFHFTLLLHVNGTCLCAQKSRGQKILFPLVFIASEAILEKPRGNEGNSRTFFKSGEIDKMLEEQEKVDESRNLPVNPGEFAGLLYSRI